MDDELVSAFLDEGAELLDHIEPTLLEIQQAIKDGKSQTKSKSTNYSASTIPLKAALASSALNG